MKKNKRKKMEVTLSESERRYRLMTDNMLDTIVLLDRNGTCIYVTPSIKSLFGYEPDELVGKDLFITVHPDDQQAVLSIFQNGINDSVPRKMEYRCLHRDGSFSWVESVGNVIRGEGGGIDFIVVSTRDITERREAENRIRELNDTLIARTTELEKQKVLAEAADRAKSEFLANMSHEFSTPLNAVLGFSNVLRDGLAGELNERQRGYLDSILKAGGALLELSRNMVELASMDLASAKLDYSRIRVRDLLNSAAEDISAGASLKKIHVECRVEGTADIAIDADAPKLLTALRHLAGNAVKFTGEGGSVDIMARMTVSEHSDAGELLEITVSDTGKGIKAEDLPLLFTSIGQLDSPFTKKERGAGIGLMLVKRIMDVHGGTVRAESEFGKGSAFIITLPMEKSVQEREREREKKIAELNRVI